MLKQGIPLWWAPHQEESIQQSHRALSSHSPSTPSRRWPRKQSCSFSEGNTQPPHQTQSLTTIATTSRPSKAQQNPTPSRACAPPPSRDQFNTSLPRAGSCWARARAAQCSVARSFLRSSLWCSAADVRVPLRAVLLARMLGTEPAWRSCGRGLWRFLRRAAGGSPRALSAVSSSAPPAGSRAAPSPASFSRRVFSPRPVAGASALRSVAGAGLCSAALPCRYRAPRCGTATVRIGESCWACLGANSLFFFLKKKINYHYYFFFL